MSVVEHYILAKEEPLRSLLDMLHYEICKFDPEIKSSIKWNIPFYSKLNILCYVNPLKSGGVELVFFRSALYRKEVAVLLDKKKRKVMRGMTIKDISSFDHKIFSLCLQEALRYDPASKMK